MSEPQTNITRFWTWLQACQEQLDEVTDAEHPFFDVILQRLKQVDDRLWFEVSQPDADAGREFVVTVGGEAEAFPIVESLVAAAPPIPSWRFVPLKPPMGFEFVIDYENVRFDPRTMWFNPLASKSAPEKVILRIAIPNYRPELEDKANNALWIILDTALGERTTTLDIGHVEACAPPDDPKAARFFPLPELPQFIQWHRVNRPTQ